MATPEHATKYIAALTRPFDSDAEGAQVPDQWSFPTQTSFLRANFTLQTTDISGNLDFVVQPNCFSTVAASAASTNLITGPVLISTPNTWSRCTANGTINSTTERGFTEGGMINESNMKAQFSRYRVVGWGVRVRALQAPLNQQGKILFAKVPSLNTMAMYNLTAGTSQWNQYLNYYGLPGVDSTGFISTGINSLPSVHETTVATLSAEGGIDIPGQLCSPLAYGFRDATNISVLGTAAGGNIAQGMVTDMLTTQNPQQNPGAATVSGGSGLPTTYSGGIAGNISSVTDPDFMLQGGWSTLCCRATGLVASANTPVFDLEVIFHLEGNPPVGSIACFASAGSHPPVHVGLLNAAHAAASTMPAFQRVLKDVRQRGAHIQHGLHRVSHHLGYHNTGAMFTHFGEMAGALLL